MINIKVAQINITCGNGSTGKICLAVSELLTEKVIDNRIYYTSGESDYPLGFRYMKPYEAKIQALKSRIFGNYGFNSKSATKRLIKKLHEFSPDVIHLHNIHGHNVHLKLLFSYIKTNNIKLFWTFHDCWAFTGYCPHYTMAKCDKWETSCEKCKQKKHYTWFFDRSKTIFEKKKSLFSGLDLTIITPSQWLADQVKRSFLSGYPIRVINNGIDLEVFKPRKSDFRKKHNIEDKFILLGVAFDWGVRKGLDVFIELSKKLDSRFQIVLVGTNDKIDKQLPNNIISIHRTANQIELAELYTAADLFVNPTREDTFPTVNLESLACGTPILTFYTGGSAECIDEKSGAVVDCDDERALYDAILKIEASKPFSSEDCRNRSLQFLAESKYSEYVEILLETSSKN